MRGLEKHDRPDGNSEQERIEENKMANILEATLGKLNKRIEKLDKRIKFLESCITNDARKRHFRKMADRLCETIRVQNKLLNKLAENNKQLKTENKKLIEGQRAKFEAGS